VTIRSKNQNARHASADKSAAGDPLDHAFRHFGLNPENVEDRNKLLQLMAQELFCRRRPGRPPGTRGANKLTQAWYLQLLQDALIIKRRHPAKLSRAGLARLLKQKFKERYGHVSAEWLRQCLLLPRSEFRQARSDFAKYILAPTEYSGLGRCAGFLCECNLALPSLDLSQSASSPQENSGTDRL
jgi:hypothetical protein